MVAIFVLATDLILGISTPERYFLFSLHETVFILYFSFTLNITIIIMYLLHVIKPYISITFKHNTTLLSFV